MGTMSGPKLTTLFQVRLRPSEKRALARLARHFERTPSEVVRRLISDETARLGDVLKTVRHKETDHGSEETTSKG
jgi:predicted transcriptional regulator